jgi:hypothetical protein
MKLYEQKWRQFLLQEEAPPGTSVDTEDKVIKIPKFRISEKFGQPGSADRQIIESFTAKIAPGLALQAKIESLNKFASDCDSNCIKNLPVNQILANLVFLDCLASVIEDFNPSTGGFLFESLIAALIGGKAEQIKSAGGKDTPAVDVVDNKGDQWSLKFFFHDGSKYVKQSYNKLENAVEKSPVNYLIGLKNRESKGGQVLAIDFYKFEINSENIINFKPKGGETQINIPLSLIVNPDSKEEYEMLNLNPVKYATLNFGSKKQLKTIAEKYTVKLGNTMHEIYQQLELLNNNVNKYYLGGDKSSALAAANNATSLKANMDKLAEEKKTN